MLEEHTHHARPHRRVEDGLVDRVLRERQRGARGGLTSVLADEFADRAGRRLALVAREDVAFGGHERHLMIAPLIAQGDDDERRATRCG